jgi:hypothetical protein
MFTDLFGGAPHARVFDYLADEPHVDHTITGIARGTEVSRPTVYKVLDDFLEEEVAVQTRTVGNSRFFQLNLDEPLIRDLITLYEAETEGQALPDLGLESTGASDDRPRSRGQRRGR